VVAQWINFLIDQREHIAIEITEQRPDLVKLGGRVVCERCRKGAKDNSSKTSGHEDSAPPPIWKTQLEFLLTFTKQSWRKTLRAGLRFLQSKEISKLSLEACARVATAAAIFVIDGSGRNED
jgi:hypothetical protein